MTGALLRVEEVAYAVRGTRILEGVSFAMEPGEVRAIIGPNGAGKSTLARCVAGVLAGFSGTVSILGKDSRGLPRRELARSVCYLPQSQGAPPAFSVREFVRMGRYVHAGFWDSLGRDDLARADRAMELAGVAGLADRLLPTLSGGERQMAAIAAGLAQEARLLVLDEPATFLDPGHQDMLLGLIRRLNREEGISILVVTHDVNMAMLFTTRTLALRGGTVVFDGPSRDLGRDGVLSGVFGMDFSFVDAGDGGRLAFSAAMTDAGQWA